VKGKTRGRSKGGERNRAKERGRGDAKGQVEDVLFFSSIDPGLLLSVKLGEKGPRPLGKKCCRPSLSQKKTVGKEQL